jgi:hypothetical protein
VTAADRIDAAEYEVGRAMADAEQVVEDRRHTTYRRRLAGQEASLGDAIVKLLEEWRRTHTLRVTLGAGHAIVEVTREEDPPVDA